MKQLFNFVTLVFLIALFAFAYSAQAQDIESTEIPDESPIVVVLPETPETGGLSDPNAFIKIILLISLLFNAVQSFWGKKSIPHETVSLIFSGARGLAKTTDTLEDDKLVDAGERFYQDLSALKQAPKEEQYNPSDNRS